eukprot:Skav234518  [mRNA]  locus=scaffold2162:280243:281287:- [translate_table: standard]
MRIWAFVLALSLLAICTFLSLCPLPLRSPEIYVPNRRTEAESDESDSALLGDVWILLDYTTSPWARAEQRKFAASLVHNASESTTSDWHLNFGVIVFHENASYQLLG